MTGVTSTNSYLSSAPVGFNGSVEARTESFDFDRLSVRVVMAVLDIVCRARSECGDQHDRTGRENF